MNFTDLVTRIFDGLSHFIPLFRVGWIITIGFGLIMLIVSYLLKRDSGRKKSPWVVGSIGLLMMLSSGVQLITSFY